MTPGVTSQESAVNPWQAQTVVIREIEHEAVGVRTYHLAFHDPAEGDEFRFRPGQFSMLYLPGVGEAAIGISGQNTSQRSWSYTVRLAGVTTRALARLRPGNTLGLRGPFGSCWPLDRSRGADILLVAGGMGLPPLRPVIDEVLQNRDRFRRVVLIYGARTPDTLIYARQYEAWARGGIEVYTIVDQADLSWKGAVGVVPQLIDRLERFAPGETTLMACGPEVMMRYAARSAEDRGVPLENIWCSLERNMQCAIGLCGHCQFGPEFVCKDGPVFRYDRVVRWLGVEAF